jgi:hypothetical protein
MNYGKLIERLGWVQLWMSEILTAWGVWLRQRSARNLGRTIRPQDDLFDRRDDKDGEDIHR